MSALLRDPLLAARVREHGFGTRGAPVPADAAKPTQVHGRDVVDAAACRGAPPPPEADAVFSALADDCVAVVTADCVPILIAAPAGAVVAAVHAGWRGLAAGVVDAGLVALLDAAACGPEDCVAAVGPHIGACCYEVDEPVLAALEAGHGAAARRAARATRPGHAQLDLGAIVHAALVAQGLPPRAIGTACASCTACDAERFHSYRRDGAGSGRLLHYIRAGAAQG